MTSDPFAVLGLARNSTPEEIRAARRELARLHHPDAGGDVEQMRRINVAAADALRAIALAAGATGAAGRTSATDRDGSGQPHRASEEADVWDGMRSDVPSFVVEALPAETFEALLLAAAELGELEDDDPPYELRILLAAPVACWCQLNVVPDAGASTVSISIAATENGGLPALIDVRNAWIDALNALDWNAL
jgi:hypothetical protein